MLTNGVSASTITRPPPGGIMKHTLPFQAAVALAFCVVSLCAGAAPAAADTLVPRLM